MRSGAELKLQKVSTYPLGSDLNMTQTMLSSFVRDYVNLLARKTLSIAWSSTVQIICKNWDEYPTILIPQAY